MPVVIKYVVERNGVEKMTFSSKAEADHYDKLLETAENYGKQVIADPARVAAGKLGTSEARKRLNLMSKTLFGRI